MKVESSKPNREEKKNAETQRAQRSAEKVRKIFPWVKKRKGTARSGCPMGRRPSIDLMKSKPAEIA